MCFEKTAKSFYSESDIFPQNVDIADQNDSPNCSLGLVDFSAEKTKEKNCKQFAIKRIFLPKKRQISQICSSRHRRTILGLSKSFSRDSVNFFNGYTNQVSPKMLFGYVE